MKHHIWDDLACWSIVVLSARLLPRRAMVFCSEVFGRDSIKDNLFIFHDVSSQRILQRSPLLVDLHTSVLCSFVFTAFFVPFAVTGRSSWLLCPAVCLCYLSSFLELAIRLVDPRVTFALHRCCLSQLFVHGDWFIHLSSVLTSYFGSHPPTRGGVLEHRCFECSPLATTGEGLR